MKVNVLFFGIATDLVGENNLKLDIEKAINVSGFKTLLKEKFPTLDKINSYAISVNEEYAEDDLVLKENDIIAIIPPVSGG
jgi:molybdopterin converting factor subunit 1